MPDKKSPKVVKDQGAASEILDHFSVDRIPDSPYTRGCKPRTKGKTFEGGITRFMAVIFEANEEFPLSKKLTDPSIMQLLIEEFPEAKTTKSLMEGRISVPYLRKSYNLGSFTRGVEPKKKSVRWNINGEPIIGTGRRPMTREEMPDHVKALFDFREGRVANMQEGKKRAQKKKKSTKTNKPKIVKKRTRTGTRKRGSVRS